MEYIHVPRDLVQDRSLGDKRVLVFAAMMFSGWRGGNIDELTRCAGYCTDRHAGKARAVISDIARGIDERGYMRGEQCRGGFAVIERTEYESIMRTRNTGSNPSHLMLLLAHIRMSMIRLPGRPEYYSDLMKRISEKTGLSGKSVSKGLDGLARAGIIYSEELPRYKDETGRWHSSTRVFVNMHRPCYRVSTYDWRNEVWLAKKTILNSQTGQ